MILKPLIVDGQTIHVQVTKEEARQRYLNQEELIFTDEAEKSAFIQSLSSDDDQTKAPKRDRKGESKMDKLMKIIPFLEAQDIHELLSKILDNEETSSGIDLMMIIPFLSQEDTDKIFAKAIKDNRTKIDIVAVAPFVSEQSLSLAVDLYIQGKIEADNMDDLYPFLSSKDVKRLFEYILKN